MDSDKNNVNLCPKCGKAKVINEIECPYCGIIYSKFKHHRVNKSKKEISTSSKNSSTFEPKKTISTIFKFCTLGIFDTDRIKPRINKTNIQVVPYRFNGENIPDQSIKIKSFTRDIDYSVSPKNQSCTCPDFVEFRKQYEYGDIQRFCKHLMKAFCRKEILPFVPDYLQPLILSAKERGKGAFKEQIFSFDLNGSTVLLACNDYNAWRSVYTKDDNNEYSRYGYNMVENRWAYRKTPKNHREIISIISTI